MKSEHDSLDAALRDLPPLLTNAETRALLRCHRTKVGRLVEAGELQAVQHRARRGSPMLIVRDSVAEYLKRHVR